MIAWRRSRELGSGEQAVRLGHTQACKLDVCEEKV
jgi:hypothetical protein